MNWNLFFQTSLQNSILRCIKRKLTLMLLCKIEIDFLLFFYSVILEFRADYCWRSLLSFVALLYDSLKWFSTSKTINLPPVSKIQDILNQNNVPSTNSFLKILTIYFYTRNLTFFNELDMILWPRQWGISDF